MTDLEETHARWVKFFKSHYRGYSLKDQPHFDLTQASVDGLERGLLTNAAYLASGLITSMERRVVVLEWIGMIQSELIRRLPTGSSSVADLIMANREEDGGGG